MTQRRRIYGGTNPPEMGRPTCYSMRMVISGNPTAGIRPGSKMQNKCEMCCIFLSFRPIIKLQILSQAVKIWYKNETYGRMRKDFGAKMSQE